MIQNLRDDTHRSQWQSCCACLSLLGQRLAVSLEGRLQPRPKPISDSKEVDHDTISGTFISPNELLPILKIRDARIPLRSPTSSYPLHLVLALTLHAQSTSSGPALPGCYVYPKPLSPGCRPESAVSAHTGPTSLLLAGVTMESSSVSPGFRYGAWVIDPSSVGPAVHTFGISADLPVSCLTTRPANELLADEDRPSKTPFRCLGGDI